MISDSPSYEMWRLCAYLSMSSKVVQAKTATHMGMAPPPCISHRSSLVPRTRYLRAPGARGIRFVEGAGPAHTELVHVWTFSWVGGWEGQGGGGIWGESEERMGRLGEGHKDSTGSMLQ